MRLRLLYILFVLLPLHAFAQFTYVIDQSIPVEEEGKILKMPWAGGLNSAQINTMDLNGDGTQDLVVFDRAANKISTFLNLESEYAYHPEYELLFPKEISKWMLLRDYNCDGKKDIFFPLSNGIAVYKNTTMAGENLSWEKLKFFAPPIACAPAGTKGLFTEIILTTTSYSETTCSDGSVVIRPNQTNVFPGTNDIPSITDMDGDGDLDILHMRFVNPGTVQYHKNMSMENYGTCDSLAYERLDQRWGDFEECSCGKFAFGEACSASGGKTNHNVGKAILALDINGDGNKDLLFSEEDCPSLYVLQNEGTTENADINTSSFFPQSKPIFMPLFPATFFEDVDFDGVPDLLASPAVYGRTGLNNPFTNSVWFYKNTGTAQSPNFTFNRDNFLQDEMIEVGDYAYPTFVDADGDGDQDLFIGNYGNAQFRGVIAHYENVGTASSPAFKLVTDDYLGLSILSRYNMKPQFVDITGDGNLDLAFLISEAQNFTTSLLYIAGTQPNTISFDNLQIESANFQVGANENIFIGDIDQDGLADILLGKSTGALEYWRNTGPAGSFNYTLQDNAFMGLGSSLTRTNLNTSISDLDNDGREDLLIGDQSGNLTVYGDFRGTLNSPQPITEIIYDSFSEVYTGKNLGARIKPTVVNLFNNDKPAIAVGTVAGGMVILKNDGGQLLPDQPEITIYPNPLTAGESLSVLTDRGLLMQLFTITGQKLTEPLFVSGKQPYSLSVSGMSPGLYIARFIYGGKTYGKKFVIY
ncbi:MAG: T9SS type A sorting domain-containing protein [Cyclobacteriaceae bacterium]